jgi:hypothetical protein
MVQAKVFSHVSSGMHLLFSIPDTRKHIGSELIVFHFFNALFNHFAQVESLGAPRLGCQEVKPLLGFWSQTNPKMEEYGIGGKPEDVDFVGFIDGSKLNPRQEAQDGLFMVPSRINLDIEEWLKNNLAPVKKVKPYDTH